MADTVLLTRRTLFVAGAASMMAACAKAVQRDQLVVIDQVNRVPGEPLWSALTNSFVVALSNADRADLEALSKEHARLVEPALIAVANECSWSSAHLGRLAWCRSGRGFECLECHSRWSAIGVVVTGPATVGLTLLGVTIGPTDDVVIDKSVRVRGVASVPVAIGPSPAACASLLPAPQTTSDS